MAQGDCGREARRLQKRIQNFSASVPDPQSSTSSSLSLNATYASSPIAAPHLHTPLALDLSETASRAALVDVFSPDVEGAELEMVRASPFDHQFGGQTLLPAGRTHSGEVLARTTPFDHQLGAQTLLPAVQNTLRGSARTTPFNHQCAERSN